MHLFFELSILLCFLASAGQAVRTRGRYGLELFAALFLLGLTRESWVLLRDLLYGFAPLHLLLGRTPLIATLIWGFSLYAAALWAEAATGERLARHRPSARFLAAVALFMAALAGFYEPLLALAGMARWQEGTRSTLGVPWIALVGYPSLAAAFFALWGALHSRLRGWRRRGALLALLPLLGGLHAQGLQLLKRSLGW